jgi:hypothetical protein
MKTLTLWLFVAVAAHATVWQRHVLSGKGESFDLPQPHRLAYFIRDPFLRDDGDDFCSDCSPAGKATVHKHHRSRTEVIK